MAQLIAGPGQGLQRNANLYPTQLVGVAADFNTDEITLPAGGTWQIPAGRWMIDCGKFSQVQYLDPITNTWRHFTGQRTTNRMVQSDGQNFRVANLTGCPVAAQVSVAGSGYKQATTSITASGGGTNSTWQAIVGGALSVISVASAGSGYGMAPLVLIGAPPQGLGVPATAFATLTSGSVSAVTLVNIGAGYTSVPPVTIVPSPFDPNNATTAGSGAVVSIGTIFAGSVTAALCTNSGISTTTSVTAQTLTVGGAGSSASVVPLVLQTVTSVGITAAGLGYGAGGQLLITSSGGGAPNLSANSIPAVELNGFIPRPMLGWATVNAAGSVTAVSIVDGGLFLSTPTVALGNSSLNVAAPTTMASLSFFMGAGTDTIIVQQF